MKRTKIINYRKTLHLSPDYIANCLGIGKYEYIHKELGDMEFTQKELKILCSIFGVEEKDLEEPTLEEKAKRIFELEKILVNENNEDKVVQSAQHEIEEIMESLSLTEGLQLNDIVMNLNNN